MRSIRLSALTAWCLVLGLHASPAMALDLYVSPKGKDTWKGLSPEANRNGTDGPFATLERARDEIRKVRKTAPRKEPITVHVRAGTYLLPRTFKLGAEDGGSAQCPVIYQAYKNETPILVGGIRVANWQPAKGAILEADLTNLIEKDRTFSQLVFAQERQHLARYPNFDPKNPYGGGWAYADGKYRPLYTDIPGESRRLLTFKESDRRQWAHPEDGEVMVFPRYNWWNNIVRIAKVDNEKRQITLEKDCSYAIRPADRYYIRGLREELDAPGEWHFDARTRKLAFWPPKPIHSSDVLIPTLRTILEIGSGASFLEIRGLTFECCEGTAVVVNGAQDCRVSGCTIRNVGDYNGSGVSIQQGRRNRVEGCDISDTGSHGISLAGGDRVTLTPAENVADNNYIHHVGVYYKQGVGISMTGCGLTASHNLIHDTPRMGIMFAGNHLLIEFNHIRHANLETADTGAVYTGGRDWIGSRGTVIRHNFFHDILGYGYENGRWVSPHFAWGVYLDDNTGGVDVIGNVVARCVRGLVHLHNGRDNLVENNIFIDGTLQQIECSGWTKDHNYWTHHLPTMIQGYESVINQPAWKPMRNMHIHPRDAVRPDGMIMTGNVFRRNILDYTRPSARYINYRHLPFDGNTFEDNLIWHHGQPVTTPLVKIGKNLSDNLAPNPSFELAGNAGLPQDWNWQIRPLPTAKSERVMQGASAGQACLRIDACWNADKPRDNYPIIVSRPMTLTPGKAYRLQAKMKATEPGVKASLMLQSYLANVYFWSSYPNETTLDANWKTVSFDFTIPGPGAKGFHEKMKEFRVRFDFPGKSGSIFTDDVDLREVEVLDSWTAWQSVGLDRQSRIADPLFMDRAKDDFRLKSESPALKMGFQPIPFDKMGPYADKARASWPIVEAIGAREKPLVSEH